MSSKKIKEKLSTISLKKTKNIKNINVNKNKLTASHLNDIINDLESIENTKYIKSNSNSNIVNNCSLAINKNLSYNNINTNLTLESFKNGSRIFNNKTEYTKFDFNDKDKLFIEFKQLMYENLLLKDNFEELINEDYNIKIKSCLICSFVYDDLFFEPIINKFNIKSFIVKDKINEGHNVNLTKINDNITYIYPKIDFILNWGKFHSKLIIFKFDDFIRIIVPSANFTNIDWYHLGQVIWFQDFYTLKDKENNNKEGKEFLNYLEEFVITPYLKYSKKQLSDINIDLSIYNYSNANAYLVSTISGRFKSNINNYGLLRVNSILSYKIKGFANTDDFNNNELLCQCSSFGKIKEKWISKVLENFKCNPYNSINNNSKESKNKSKSKKIINNYNFECFKVYYPSIEYINKSKNGHSLSNCLFLDEATFNLFNINFYNLVIKSKYNFAHQIFHSKIFLIRDKTTKSTKAVYVGSHNLSASAWGSLELNDTQISSGNYELGVILKNVEDYNLYDFILSDYTNEQRFNCNNNKSKNLNYPWVL